MIATLLAAAAVLVAQLAGTVHLDPAMLALLSGSVVPLVTNLVTHSKASSKVKGFVMLVLSVAAGGIVAATNSGGDVVLNDWLLNMAVAFGTAYVSYKAVWDRFGVTGVLDNSSVGKVGIGAPAEPAPAPCPVPGCVHPEHGEGQ